MLGITDHVWSENLAVDEHDNLFFAYLADGGVRLATSRDGGRSWRLLGFVSSPAIRRAIVVSVAARGRGEIALTYYGTPDKGDPLGASGMNWRAWMTYSRERARRRPGLPLGRDLARSRRRRWTRRCPAAARPSRRSSSTPAFSSPARREVRGAFTRWTGKHLPELVLAKLRLPKP